MVELVPCSILAFVNLYFDDLNHYIQIIHKSHMTTRLCLYKNDYYLIYLYAKTNLHSHLVLDT